MKIINKTQWATEDLRRVFSAVLADSNKHEARKVEGAAMWNRKYREHFKSKILKITIVYSRGGGFSGYAFLHSGIMRIRVPKPTGEAPAFDVFKLAYVFEHELAHCRGFQHKGMGCLNSWDHAKAENYPCAVGLTVGIEPSRPKAEKADGQIVRYQRAVAAAARWAAKRKRAANAEKKALTKVKRYERIFEADGRLAALKQKN